MATDEHYRRATVEQKLDIWCLTWDAHPNTPYQKTIITYLNQYASCRK